MINYNILLFGVQVLRVGDPVLFPPKKNRKQSFAGPVQVSDWRFLGFQIMHVWHSAMGQRRQNLLSALLPALASEP